MIVKTYKRYIILPFKISQRGCKGLINELNENCLGTEIYNHKKPFTPDHGYLLKSIMVTKGNLKL